MRTITIPGDPVEEDKDKDEELTIGKRFLMSFGDKGTIQKLKSMEEEAGLRGKLDWGDLADVAGGMFPFAGGMLGAGGGTPFWPFLGCSFLLCGIRHFQGVHSSFRKDITNGGLCRRFHGSCSPLQPLCRSCRGNAGY